MSPDRAGTVLVLAKEPVPGRAKTRLQARFDPEQTAALAAAALTDTVTAVRAARIRRRVLAWQQFSAGPVTAAPWGTGFELVRQVDGGLDLRLAAAFDAVRGRDADGVLLVGMDTPQLRPDQLEFDWGGADAVLGLAEDGGFWAIGLRGAVDPAAVFPGVPMSTDRTGAAQLARLHDLGLEVALLPPLRDVDTPTDAAAVARAHPGLRFSAVHEALTAGQAVDGVFDRAYAGGSAIAHARSPRSPATPGGLPDDPLRLDVGRWLGVADEVDAMVLTRCRPPVLDLGCGPGRLVSALAEQGVPALGVDLSLAAIQAVRARGGCALHRDLYARLPLEGSWGSVVLMDSNLGLGADLPALLARCVELVAPGGRVVCEVDPDAGAAAEYVVELSVDGVSVDLPWGRYGVVALTAAARRLDLVVEEEWSADGRVFVSLLAP